MDLTARDIHEKQFHDSWRGYNQEEVDEFLDRIADVLDRVQRENTALNARITELDHAVATSRDTEEMLKKTLVTAQQAAEEAIASAKAKAEALIQEAEERTRKVHREADEKLQQADAEARRKGLEADREHTIRKREIDASLEKLRRFESDLKRRLASFLNEQQRGLQRLTEDEPPEYRAPRSIRSEPDQTVAVAAAVAVETETEITEPPIARDDAEQFASDDEGGVDIRSTNQWIPDFVASQEQTSDVADESTEEPASADEGDRSVEDDEQPPQGEPDAEAALDDQSRQNGSSSNSWEEPGFISDGDIGSLYETGEIEVSSMDDDEAHESAGETDTVTLAEEETAPARSRSSRLFWRGDS